MNDVEPSQGLCAPLKNSALAWFCHPEVQLACRLIYLQSVTRENKQAEIVLLHKLLLSPYTLIWLFLLLIFFSLKLENKYRG